MKFVLVLPFEEKMNLKKFTYPSNRAKLSNVLGVFGVFDVFWVFGVDGI